jgi:hypothetical protein
MQELSIAVLCVQQKAEVVIIVQQHGNIPQVIQDQELLQTRPTTGVLKALRVGLVIQGLRVPVVLVVPVEVPIQDLQLREAARIIVHQHLPGVAIQDLQVVQVAAIQDLQAVPGVVILLPAGLAAAVIAHQAAVPEAAILLHQAVPEAAAATVVQEALALAAREVAAAAQEVQDLQVVVEEDDKYLIHQYTRSRFLRDLFSKL